MGARNATSEPAPIRRVLWAVAGLVTAVRLAFAWRYFGFSTGDDVEILSAGFMRALGLPYEPWEIRHLLVSDALVAPVLAAAAALGVESTPTLAWLATLPFVGLATLNVLLVFALGRRWLADRAGSAAGRRVGATGPDAGARQLGPGGTPGRRADAHPLPGDAPGLHASTAVGATALCAATLYAFHWLPLGYGSTVYPRTASTTCVLAAALLLAVPRGGGIRRQLAAGGLLAVAVAVRYSEIVFLLPLLAAVVFGDEARSPRQGGVAADWRGAAVLCGGFAAAGLVLFGVYDWLAWGRPFTSLRAFAEYTLVERQASSLEPQQPWYWYLWRLPKWTPVTLLPLFFAQRSYRRLARPALFVVLPVLALSLIHHKQLRYLQGVIPFLCLAAAAAALGWWRAGRRRSTAVLLGLSLLLGLPGIGFLQKKSMAAVVAARSIARQEGVTAVALAQPWAYGGRLYLPHGM